MPWPPQATPPHLPPSKAVYRSLIRERTVYRIFWYSLFEIYLGPRKQPQKNVCVHGVLEEVGSARSRSASLGSRGGRQTRIRWRRAKTDARERWGQQELSSNRPLWRDMENGLLYCLPRKRRKLQRTRWNHSCQALAYVKRWLKQLRALQPRPDIAEASGGG